MYLTAMYYFHVKIADLIWLGQRLVDTGQQEMRVHQPGVPTAEYVVMRHLVEGPPSTITSLVDRTGYAQSSVSTAVANLVERGWAETTSDPTDGRRTLVFAPDRIRQGAETALSAEAEAFDRLLAGLTPARRKVVAGALDDLLVLLRAQADAAGAS